MELEEILRGYIEGLYDYGLEVASSHDFSSPRPPEKHEDFSYKDVLGRLILRFYTSTLEVKFSISAYINVEDYKDGEYIRRWIFLCSYNFDKDNILDESIIQKIIDEYNFYIKNFYYSGGPNFDKDFLNEDDEDDLEYFEEGSYWNL